MAISKLHCPKNLYAKPELVPRDYGLRDIAIEHFDSARFLESLRASLSYLLPQFEIEAATPLDLKLVQGTALIEVRLNEDLLSVRSVLAEFPNETFNPAPLRYLLSRIAGTGQMFQPRLVGQRVQLRFEERLKFLHPQKLIEVLHKLPYEADSHDWIAAQFALDASARVQPESLSPEQWQQALHVWRTHWREIDALMLESRRRRSVRFLDAIARVALHQIRDVLPFCGMLRARLNEASYIFCDRDENPVKRDQELARTVRFMLDADETLLRSCFGHLAFAFNPWQEGTPAAITQAIGDVQHMQSTGELRSNGRFMEATLDLIANFRYLLSAHVWPAEIERALRAALEECSDQPWRQAAEGLWQAARNIVREFCGHPEETEEEAHAAA